MEWNELKNRIYHWDGSCRDIYVLDATRADWSKWVDYINQGFSIDWYNGRTGRKENQIDFNVLLEYWSGNLALCSIAKVFIGNTQINAHFFDEKQLENDIDPREFNSMEDHSRLMDFMRGLSIRLNKVVILTPENEHKKILIEVSREEIKYF